MEEFQYSERIDDDKEVIFVKTRGVITARELGPRTGETRLKASNLDFNVLLDFRESKIEVSMVEVYHWFSDYHDKIDVRLKRIPCALVCSEIDEDFFRDVELIIRNRGGAVQSFTDVPSALKWLAGCRIFRRMVS